MRKFLILFAVLVGAGLTGPMTKDALAQCTHLGGTVTCPVGIANGSNSLSFGANNTINWSGGQVSSGACCPADAGLSTGAGLLNQNNQLGGPGFHWGPVTTGVTPADPVGSAGPNDGIVILGQGFEDFSCAGGQCTEGPAAAVFGSGPGGGYLCDGGGAGCGSDQWPVAPQPGFGECGAGGCGGTPPLLPLTTNIPGTGPYAANQTTGAVDPFGGVGAFVDPITGEATELPDDSSKWPEHVKHADALNNAYVNGEIGYPFTDPNWRTRSVEDYKNNPTLAPQVPLPGVSNIYTVPQTTSRPDFPLAGFVGNSNPYAQNRTLGAGIDPFGGGGSFTDPRTGISESISDDPTKWPERIRHADDLNTAYVNGQIAYPFNDPNWENKSVDDFRTSQPAGPTAGPTGFGSGIAAAPGASSSATSGTGAKYSDKAGRFGIGSDTTLGGVGGLSLLYQASKNFGVQAIISFPSLYSTPKEDNSDLTNYVSTVLVGPAVRGDIGLAFTNRVSLEPIIGVPSTSGFSYYFSGRGGSPAASAPRTNQVPAGTRLPEVTRNTEGEYVVFDPNSGERVTIQGRTLAVTIASGVRNGVPLRDAVTEAMTNRSVATTGDGLASANAGGVTTPAVPAPPGSAPAPIVGNERPAIIVKPEPAPAPIVGNERPAIIVKPENTNIVDSIAGNVPAEFQAPSFEVVRRGINRAVAVSLPGYGIDKVYLATPEGGQAMVDGLRAGKSPKEAYLDGRRADSAVRREERQKREAAERTKSNQIGNALVDNVPAEFRRQPSTTTSTTTATAPSTTSTTTNPDGLASANSGGVTTPVVPRPARPAGESVSFLEEALVQGKTYRIEIVRTPDGRTLAVGTGDQAGHVFGEAKEGGFGWRNEGPWTPPPAPAPIVGNERPAIIVAPDSVPSSPPATLREAVEQANAPATSPASTSTVSIAPLSPQRAANLRIRLQIAGSDREQMTATANAAIDSPNSFVATGR